MKVNNIIKTAQSILIIGAIIFVIVFIYSIIQTINYGEKFKKTELNISRTHLIENWGKPNREFDMGSPSHPRHILMYKDLIGCQYIFVIKENEKIISEKYMDD